MIFGLFLLRHGIMIHEMTEELRVALQIISTNMITGNLFARRYKFLFIRLCRFPN